jgi:hypothetical protein
MSGPLVRLFPQTVVPPTPTAAGSPFPGYPGSTATDAQLLINNRDVTPVAEWDASWEERADGTPGQMTVTIQDRGNANVYGNSRDRITLKIAGVNAFDGEIVTSQIDLPPGVPWRRWKISATDWNTVPDLRLVNVPSGESWLSTDGGATFQNVDPNAQGGGDDAHTVADLFAAYAARPDGSAFDASSYVYTYIPNSVLINQHTGESNWAANPHESLKSALDNLRNLAGVPIYTWIDPDGKVHWVALPDLVTPSNNPPAPAAITDVSPNGTTTVGGRGLSIQYDGSYMPQAVYVTGVTDYVYNGGNVLTNGTGWAGGITAPSLRQIAVDAQSVTRQQRDKIGAAYATYGQRARVRGTVTVGKPLTSTVIEKVDGWRCGQMLQITDARLPVGISGQSWPILTVKGKLWSTVNVREYTLEFGDAPRQAFSAKYRTTATKIKTPLQPAHIHEVYFSNLHPLPSTSQTVTSQMIDAAKKPVRAPGVPVVWSMTVTDSTGAVVTGQGSIVAITSSTDTNGETTATFTTGATAGLTYDVRADTP